ncbi:NAD(P)-dependent oxidoreductase [candidate division TA06 bacterium]|nr:NAD(P)-dependent oxidoreductase [candidate division TA06 bacterium]
MILITGGTGFVGSNIVDKARGKGLSIRCLVRSEAGFQSASGGEPLLGESSPLIITKKLILLR